MRQNQIHFRIHTRLYFQHFFFNPYFPIFSGVRKEASAGVNTLRKGCNFGEKNPKFLLPRTLATENHQHTRVLFSHSYLHPCLALAPCGLRAHGKSVESRTRTVSFHVTLAQESRRTHSAREYSRQRISEKPKFRNLKIPDLRNQ